MALVIGTLRGSAFARPDRWPSAVVVIRQGERFVTSRGCFSSWLRAADLQAQAHECSARKVPKGSVLSWLELDIPEVALAGFAVVKLL